MFKLMLCLSFVLMSCTAPNLEYNNVPLEDDDGVSGLYWMFLNEYKNTCDPNGPAKSLGGVFKAFLEVDLRGQGTFQSGFQAFGVAVETMETGFRMSSVFNDCWVSDYYGVTSLCSKHDTVAHVEGEYSVITGRFIGEFVYSYSMGCGVDGKSPGESRVSFNGNREVVGTHCKPNAYYCYTEKNCVNKLPSCVMLKDSCLNAKSLMQVASFECQNIQAN